jgi:hypothetical protein
VCGGGIISHLQNGFSTSFCTRVALEGASIPPLKGAYTPPGGPGANAYRTLERAWEVVVYATQLPRTPSTVVWYGDQDMLVSLGCVETT